MAGGGLLGSAVCSRPQSWLRGMLPDCPILRPPRQAKSNLGTLDEERN